MPPRPVPVPNSVAADSASPRFVAPRLRSRERRGKLPTPCCGCKRLVLVKGKTTITSSKKVPPDELQLAPHPGPQTDGSRRLGLRIGKQEAPLSTALISTPVRHRMAPRRVAALSLVTFFGPAKKATRLPAGTGGPDLNNEDSTNRKEQDRRDAPRQAPYFLSRPTKSKQKVAFPSRGACRHERSRFQTPIQQVVTGSASSDRVSEPAGSRRAASSVLQV